MAAEQFTLPELPWAQDSLEKHGMSANTISFHYGKHHAGYFKKLNAAVEGTDFAGQSLESVIVEAHKGQNQGVFNNAAQAYNHTFFWHSLTPEGGGGAPDEGSAIGKKINEDFGSYDAFRDEFSKTAATHFGSGWAWLVLDGGKLKVEGMHDAGNPLPFGQKPILTIDVWEHAYYLDVQNRRPDYVAMFLDKLVNWKFADAQLSSAGSKL